jgi:hypothetical protein
LIINLEVKAMTKTKFISDIRISHIIFLSFIILQPIYAQECNKEISFELDRNKVILQARVNKHRPLNIILDSGMPWAGLYLFHSDLIEEFDLQSNTQVTVGGAGSGNPSSGLRIMGNELWFGEVRFKDQMVVVSRSEHTQTFPTDGVIGWTIFSNPVVYINYDDQIISLLDQLPELDSEWETVDIELNENHLPFIKMNVQVNPDETPMEMLFYLDLAASEHLEMLNKEDRKFKIPETGDEKVLGTGLSGDFKGLAGTVKSVEIAGFKIDECPATFPNAASRTTQGEKNRWCNWGGIYENVQYLLRLSP